jgi:hypothetical protein
MSTSAAPRRAGRITAPGAKRITFLGVMAVPDEFGRLRVLVVDELADGTECRSRDVLVRAIPDLEGAPYRLHPERPDSTGVWGTATLAVPARHRAHWLAEAARLRGREVRVEATLRRYEFERDGESVAGSALDVSAVEPLGEKLEAPARRV